MGELVELKIPEPIDHNGRKFLVGGWSTAGVGQWLFNKKLGEQHTSLSEIASFSYGRDSQANRQKVRNNIAPLRRWLAERGEFLLVKYGYLRRIDSIKVCNPADDNDRQIAVEQLVRLESRCEITEAERIRWEQMLYLPSSNVAKEGD